MGGLSEAVKNRRKRQYFTASALVVVLVAGRAWPVLGFFIPACMFAGIGIALSRGRKWCDWLCPRGAFLDVLPGAGGPGRVLPRWLRPMRLRLAVLVLLGLMMGFQVAARWPDPGRVGLFFVNLLTVTTVLAIPLAFLLHRRAWCCLCPVGTLSALAGGRRRTLEIDSGSCVSCRLCARGCPIGVRPMDFRGAGREVVRDADCLKCGLCVAACPKRALSFPAGGQSGEKGVA